MTPKEKAVDLIGKFYVFNYIGNSHAKKCALMCVDELLNTAKQYECDIWDNKMITYWQTVKTEIGKL